VQHELVDHLASDIESEMNEDNTLSFESALSKVYSKFPISGFSKYVKQSESAMNTMWYKMILSEFTKYGGIHNFSDSDKLQIVIFSFLLSINIIWNVMAFYRFPALISNVLNEKYNHLNLEIKLNSD